jgi:hypothetical protein
VAKQERKKCKLTLADIQRGFPADRPACAECTYCPLLKFQGKKLHCGFLPASPGKYVNPRVQTKTKRRIATLKADYEANGVILPLGEEVLLDRQQNAGIYLWATARNPGFGRLGKFLVNRGLLDLDGPLLRTAHSHEVERITDVAVLIAGIWWPRCEIRFPAELVEGTQVEFIEVPEWLAQLKGLC